MPTLIRTFFTTKANGRRQGLAVSHHIAVEHGGRIMGLNREDGGALFQLAIAVVR